MRISYEQMMKLELIKIWWLGSLIKKNMHQIYKFLLRTLCKSTLNWVENQEKLHVIEGTGTKIANNEVWSSFTDLE